MKDFMPQLLVRPRVNRQLAHSFSYPLTVVQAPMGFGKTTAVREFIRLNRLSPIFLSLMGAGSSPAYCWERITAKVRKEDPELGNQLLSLGFPSDIPQVAKIVELLEDCAFPEPKFLFIDDYQLIDIPQVADLLAAVAGERIPNLHIVLLTREISCLPVEELAQKQLCWVISQEELGFRPEEVEAYLQLIHTPLPREEVNRITRWTGGWISGIYLLGRGLQQGIPRQRETLSRLNGSIDKLLELNLYSTYDEKTRRFMEQLSFLDAFTPEQTACVFDDPTAPAFLLSLVQGNAFLSYSRSAEAYQMTDLLREFLQRKARQNGFDPSELYRRMGRWFLARNRRILAYDYLYRAGDIETILETLNRGDYIDVHFAQFPQIHMIFEGLPDDVFFRYPLAALRHIRVKSLTGSLQVRQDMAQLLSRIERHYLQVDMEEERRSCILGEIHNTWVLASFNDSRAMVEHAVKAVSFFRGQYSCLISNETEFTYGANSLLYSYYTRAGSLRDTVDFISKNFHILAQAVEGCGSGSESLILAEYALETGDFESVTINAYKAIYESRLYRQVCIELCAAFTLCRLAIAQGKPAEADRLLTQLSATVEAEHNSVLNTTLTICAAYLDCCLGRLEQVPAWLRERDLGHGSFMYRGLGFHDVAVCFVTMREKRYVQLLVYCDALKRNWESFSCQMGLIYHHIFRAAALSAIYGPDQGAAVLCQALDVAIPDGVVMPFAECAAEVLPLLSHPVVARRYPAEALEAVSSRCRSYLEGLSSQGPKQVRLSERELEILHLLSQSLSHSEIAAQVYISVSTVRYHIKNIYQKLGVNNKVSALTKAREAGLLR